MNMNAWQIFPDVKPPVDGEYLVVETNQFGQFRRVGVFTGTGWIVDAFSAPDVTHWQRLPELPGAE